MVAIRIISYAKGSSGVIWQFETSKATFHTVKKVIELPASITIAFSSNSEVKWKKSDFPLDVVSTHFNQGKEKDRGMGKGETIAFQLQFIMSTTPIDNKRPSAWFPFHQTNISSIPKIVFVFVDKCSRQSIDRKWENYDVCCLFVGWVSIVSTYADFEL